MLWDDLRIVLAVAREGTLSKAATRLGVNHSTVSRRLAALSEQLGVRLFDRGDSGYEPTPAGQDVLQVAARVEDDVLALEGRILGRDAQLRGALCFTTVDLLVWMLADDLASFRQAYPQVDLEVSADFRPKDLSRREADVALRLTNQPPEHLVGRRLCRMEFAIYGAPCLVGDDGPPPEWSELPWVVWTEESEAVVEKRWLAENVPGATIGARVDSTMSFMAALRAGLGVGFSPCISGDADPRIRRIGPVEESFGVDLWLLTAPELRRTARVRAFTDHLAEATRRVRDGLEGRGAATSLGPYAGG